MPETRCPSREYCNANICTGACEQSNKSEVARLPQEINREYEAARLGLSGLAIGMGQHRFITKRMEQIAELHSQLRSLVGDEAMAMIAEQVEGEPDRGGQDAELATRLSETTHYAINPAFKERLRVDLLTKFVEQIERME